MRLNRFVFEARAEVYFSAKEVFALIEMSERHYDWECKAASKQGGVLWGLRNMLSASSKDDEQVFTTLPFHKIDLLRKIAEQGIGSEAVLIHSTLGTVLTALNDATKIINEGSDVNNGDTSNSSKRRK